MIEAVLPLELPGSFRIRLRRFADLRGAFVKCFQEEPFQRLGLETGLKECFFSVSSQGVLRGLHFQSPPHDQAKMVLCLAGKARDVILDLRTGSPAFGQHARLDLDAEIPELVYIPRGLAHGFLATAPNTMMLYLVTSSHVPEHDAGIRWDSCGIDWGIEAPILSARDRAFPPLADFRSAFTSS